MQRDWNPSWIIGSGLEESNFDIGCILTLTHKSWREPAKVQWWFGLAQIQGRYKKVLVIMVLMMITTVFRKGQG